MAEAGFVRLADELHHAIEAAGRNFPKRLKAMATAYVRFAVTDPQLLELMFARKQRVPDSSLHDAGDRAFAVILELIRQGQATGFLEEGDLERLGLIFFSTLQGIAALVTVGMVAADRADDVVSDAVAHFLRGSRPPAKA